MKILLVDISLLGHRQKYIDALFELNTDAIEIQMLLPDEASEIYGTTKVHAIQKDLIQNHNPIGYVSLIRQVRGIVKAEGIDIVHFLCGDAFYRFFGIGLHMIPAKCVITYHHVVLNSWRSFSINRLFANSAVGVVHTSAIQHQLQRVGIDNVQHVEYPMHDYISQKTTVEAKRRYDLPENLVVFGALGGTSYYKGLDLLIQALNGVQRECCLFVAGSKSEFDEKFIDDNLNNPKISGKVILRRLSEEELADAIQATDVVVLPYRREFDGASGMMINAAFHGKTIIGAEHGSMGELIREYCLGRTFVTESAESLMDAIEEELKAPFVRNDRAKEYISLLSKDAFIERHRRLYSEVLGNNQVK